MSYIEELRDPMTNVRAMLLDAVEEQGSGDWFKVEGRDKFSIHVIISNTATVQIYVSNEESPAADGAKYGNDITASALAEIKVPVSWIKAKVSAYTSGEVSAILLGV